MKLASISVFFGLCASLAYSAALNPAVISSLAARTPDVENVYEDVVGYVLPDGHRKIDFYYNGALSGSVVETDDGAEFFDANGALFSLDDDDLVKRQSKASVAIRFAKLFARWGKRVWDIFYCMGLNVAWKCGDEFIDCAQAGTPPWTCVTGIACAGVNAKKCF